MTQFDGQMDPTTFRSVMGDMKNGRLQRRADFLAKNATTHAACSVPGCEGLARIDDPRFNVNRYNPGAPAVFVCVRAAVHTRLFPDVFRISSARSAGVAPDTDEVEEPAQPAKARNGKEAVAA